MGVKILPDAPGLRAMPPSAAAAVRPWPRAPGLRGGVRRLAGSSENKWAFVATILAAVLTCAATILASLIPAVRETLVDLIPGRNGSVPSAARLLYADDFSRVTSGWDRRVDDQATTDYSSGAYRIYVPEANTDAWSNPGRNYRDVRIEVDATAVGGPEDNAFGILCRYKDVHDFYYFLISSDGYAGIGLKLSDNRRILSSEDGKLKVSRAVIPGLVTNHLRAECKGDLLSLYVNGDLVARATNTALAEGDVGLFAGTYEEGGTDIRFNSFSVYQP